MLPCHVQLSMGFLKCSGGSTNFERGFQLDKNASPVSVEDQKKNKIKLKRVVTSSLSHFSQTETYLTNSTAPKPTHNPQSIAQGVFTFGAQVVAN